MMAEVEQYLTSIQSQVTAGTLQQCRSCLTRFVEFLSANNLSLERLERDDLHRFELYLSEAILNQKREKISSERVRRYLSIARSFLRYLCSHNRLLIAPRAEFKKNSIPKKVPFVPSYGQVVTLLEKPDLTTAIGIRDRAMFEAVYGCGLRLSELLNLAIDDINFPAGILLVRQGKGGRRRLLPLGRCAAHYLELYLRQVRPKVATGDSHRALWLCSNGAPIGCQNTIQRRFYKYQRIVNFPLSCHTLRHAFATHLLEGGANLRCVQRMLGHRFLKTTQRYAQVRPAALKRVHQQSHPRG